MIGSKELIGSLPLQLGVGPGDLVVHPELAYPTYEVGARLAGADVLATDALTAVGPRTPALVCSTPRPTPPAGCCAPTTCARWSTGVASAATPARQRRVLRRVRLGRRARLGAAPRHLRRLDRGAPRHPLAVEALQPGGLPLRLRRRGPRAWSASSSPCARTSACRCRGRSRPRWPRCSATTRTSPSSGSGTPPAGRCCARRWRGPASASTTRRASLYLWATRGEDCWDTVAALAERRRSWWRRARSTAPRGARHVRVAFTATDERVAAAVRRLAG